MMNLKKIKRTVSLFLVIILMFVSGMNISATELSAVSVDKKSLNDKEYEKYQLSDLPSAIAESINTADKTPIEIINHETDDMYSITVKNDDGTNTLYVFQTPIKYEENNTVKLKKDTVTASTEKLSLFTDYEFESVSNEIKGFYPKNISDGIKVEYGDYEVRLMPFSENKNSLLTLNDANKAVKTENAISYAEVFGSNISLEYSSTLNGIKENIIIEKYDGRNTFNFIIDTNGLLPEKMAGDSIPLLDPETGEMKLYIGQINAKDSYVGNNENDEVHFTLFNSLMLEKLDGSQYKLTVIVDKDFLENETTVYPVTVDPTISMGTSNMADAPVYSGYPSTNYYTNDYNMVGYHGSSYKEATTYIKLKSLSSYKYINPSKVVSVYYNVYEGSGRTSSATINVRGAASDWTDSIITYSNRPGLSSPVSSLTISSSGWYNFNITTLFKNWLKYELNESTLNPNYGFALAASTTGVSSKHFCSANNTNHPPSIIVNYSEDTSIADGTYYIRSAFSDLYLDTEQNVSANGNVIQYTFHGNTNQHWTIKHQGNGYYKLYSQWYNEDKCLDVETQPTQNGSNVDVFEDSSNADWLLFKIVSNNDGTYRIISKWSDNQKVLDVCGPSYQATANIQIWEYVGVNQQKWYFEPVNDKNIDCIDDLFLLAQQFDSANASSLTFQYIRSGIYNSSRWAEVAGDIDASFSNYVSNNSSLSFLKNTHQYFYDNNQRIDFSHMCAVINAIQYDSTSFASVAVGESVVDDLSGWAGDLQTLVMDMVDSVGESNLNNYDMLYNKFSILMGSLSYSFSTEDLLADLDAVYYVTLFGNSTSNVANNLANYYNIYSQNRYTNFVDGRTKNDFNVDIYFYTRDKHTLLGVETVKWPLYGSYTISETQAEAAADAFTDYIWNLL